jgi:hypothetical protein
MIWTLAILPTMFLTDAALRVFAQTRFLVVLNAIRLTLIVSLLLWALSTFHLVGAVLVMLAATVLTRAIGLARVARVMNVKPAALVPWASVGGIVLSATIAGGVARIALTSVSWPVAGLVTAVGVYAGVYLLLLSILGVMTVTNLCVALRASSA